MAQHARYVNRHFDPLLHAQNIVGCSVVTGGGQRGAKGRDAWSARLNADDRRGVALGSRRHLGSGPVGAGNSSLAIRSYMVSMALSTLARAISTG